MSFMAVSKELEEKPYKKELVFEELLPRSFYHDDEWRQLIAEADFMGAGGRYIDPKYLPKIPPKTHFFDK